MRKGYFLLSFLLSLVLTLFLPSCQPRPDYLIDEETMIDLLTDVHMSEGLIDLQQKHDRDHEYGQQVMAAVLLKYNVSKADYDSSLIWYSQHLNSFIRVYKHVNENLKENEEHWSELASSLDLLGVSLSGDSVDLWRQANYLLMDEARLSHFRIWTFTTDTAYYPGDTVKWQMHVSGLPEGEGIMASLALLSSGTKSTDKTIAIDGATSPLITRDSLLTLVCAADSGVAISQVVATIHLLRTDSSDVALRPCVVDSLQMIRLHRR